MSGARLLLASGRLFEGEAIGQRGSVLGEVVFNTSMTGYQEILSDPSYAEQLVCFSYPEIGNTGANPEDNESAQAGAKGLIVRKLTRQGSNYRKREDLPDFLLRRGLVGIEGIDTRALIHHLRDEGAQMGIIDSLGTELPILQARLAEANSMEGSDLVTGLPARLEGEGAGVGRGSELGAGARPPPLVVVLDCGAKEGILRQLEDAGATVALLRAPTTLEAVRETLKGAGENRGVGLLVSNGPGDPAALPHMVELLRALLGELPIFGICLGCQLLALALGAQTRKLAFGHHGANHPVQNLDSGRVVITSQNHGFAIDEEGLPGSLRVSHRSLYDQSIEGIVATDYPASAVQFHPEASPGPHDANHLIRAFVQSL